MNLDSSTPIRPFRIGFPFGARFLKWSEKNASLMRGRIPPFPLRHAFVRAYAAIGGKADIGS
jgi:hypothetical protein